MRLGIDASNLRQGGGVTHLIELLRMAQPEKHGFERVVVWGGAGTLSRLENRTWLKKVDEPMLSGSLLTRLRWQWRSLAHRVRQERCDVLFVPGGWHVGGFHPFVTMSQNMLPFEWAETVRYGPSRALLRLVLLRCLQSRTFRAADGLIFLTQYAQQKIAEVMGSLPVETVVVPHGVDERFCRPPREQRRIEEYSDDSPFRILYVSTVDAYKHQWHVVDAVAELRDRGYPIQLTLIGSSYPSALKRLRRAIHGQAGRDRYVSYPGSVPYTELADSYHQADAFVFASSCENLPIILLEAMAAGLPIACSERGPMPEVAGDAVVYFNPESPKEIAHGLEQLILDPVLRATKARGALERASQYSWRDCAEQTFRFLGKAATERSVDATVSCPNDMDRHANGVRYGNSVGT